jgi:2-keto-4-pentenoate hydratase
MDDAAVDALARVIWEAREQGRTLDAAAVRHHHGGPDDLATAYRVQAEVVGRRLARGERPIGWKLGYTSLAMREQMGIEEPNCGPLTDAMVLPSPAVVPPDVTQPRVEPEIAVWLGRDVAAGTDLAGVLDAVDAANACLEVVDSVWGGYRFRLEDNTADGSSAAFVVLGERLDGPLDEVEVTMTRNGVHAGTATGASASGHPLAGVVWLAAELAGRGNRLRAGDLVITGGLLAAVPLDPGDTVTAAFTGDVGVEVHRRH